MSHDTPQKRPQTGGPQPMTHAGRQRLAEEIADQLTNHYGGQILALGIYGSLGRGQDGPYSDIEMHCILRGEGIDTCYEWSAGPWKAEVDVYSPDEILNEAAFVDGDWPITHGAYAHVRPLYDPGRFFEKLRAVTLSQPDHIFRERIAEVIVGEVYELVGKVRNAAEAKTPALLAFYASRLALWGACLLGLQHRRLFTSMGRIFNEAASLPDPPHGLLALFDMTTTGELSQPARIYEAVNRFWAGVEDWANRNGYAIVTSLEAMLSSDEA